MEITVKHLQAHPKSGVLYYRRVIPAPLRPHIHTGSSNRLTEFKVSLEEREITAPGALARYEEAHSRAEAMLSAARKRAAQTYDSLDAPTVAYLAEKFRVEELAADEARRWDRTAKERARLATDLAGGAGHELPPVPPAAKWTQSIRIALEAALSSCQALRACGDLDGIVEAWGATASELAEKNGKVIDASSQGFEALCVALNDAAASAFDSSLARLDGAAVPTPPTPIPAPTVEEKPKSLPSSGKTFDEIVLALLDKPRLGIGPAAKEHTRTALRYLRESVGPLRPVELSKAKVSEFLDHMALRPSKLPFKERDLTLPELAALYADRPDVPRQSSRSMAIRCRSLATRWKEAQAEGDIPEGLLNPFSGRKFVDAVRKPKTPKGFNADELTAIFSLPYFASSERPVRGKGEAVYWLPLLMLFTGARPEEIAQLLVTDIYPSQDGSRWLLRIAETGIHPIKGPQSLKTGKSASGARVFPIPAQLISLGLLAYVESLKAAGHAALFPLLRLKNKRGHLYPCFGEWWCERLYSNNILARGARREPGREFRHTWATAARSSGIAREAMEYLQGHKPPDGGSSNEAYGDHSPLGAQLDKLVLPVDILAIVRPWTA